LFILAGMSQAQPPYPPSAPPPPGYPPGNYPPPGGYPPGTGYAVPGTPMGSPSKTSVAAVFSLVFGILGCIPMVTSVLALICGFIGISATKNNQKSGRGLAIAGIVLGLLGVVLWGLFGGGLYTMWRVTGPTRAEGRQFIQNLADGKVDAAYAQCTSDITKDEIEGLVKTIQPMGALKDVTSFSVQANAVNGQTTSELGGAATFDKGAKPFTLSLIKQNGVWKIRGVQFDPNKTGR
jgi:hypothetical protein